ncbi:antichymotrypsin-2-like [Venturia canescens]|uniref:antichymotrypsin-2-like n=1 Tax=Venturia canescens TaxID=32260 RepID=UPI001C9C206A|nr:antichymotrypsin-2-like [Venturia canescens]XP_043288179.1 antichymotrypsin-2-like [Venturia canescens]XP_043288180.1 antichymotrypsin-2-like [Venturia canescens]XP_043288181.1 antichymotrypsin-2-like [Venturia canescens]
MRLPLVVLTIAIGSYAVPTPNNAFEAVTEYEKEQSLQVLTDAARNFSIKYFQKLWDQAYYTDRPVSPLSAFIPLFILSYGARGETREMYLKEIGLAEEKTEAAKIGYEKFLRELSACGIRVSTKMFFPPNVTRDENFVNLTEKVFNVKVGNYDETKSRVWQGPINDWVANRTNDSLAGIFWPAQINPDVSMVLVNTLSIERTWKTQFDVSRTVPRAFYLLESARRNTPPVNVSTMYTSGRFRHGRLDDFHASFIELPYERKADNDAMSMFILRMDEGYRLDVNTFVQNIASLDLNRLLNSTEDQVEVYLPKFKTRHRYRVRLSDDVMGYVRKPPTCPPWESCPQEPEMRPKDAGNFSGILTSHRKSVPDETWASVFVEVDESGLKSADSSGLAYKTLQPEPVAERKTRSISPNAVQFKVNRPFVAIIATIGKVMTNILSIKFLGSDFVPEDHDAWWYIGTTVS